MPKLPPIARTFTSTIGSREFGVECDGASSSLLVELGQPVRDVPTSEDFDWRCPVRFTRDKTQFVRSACGIDSLQALHMAFELIRVELRRLAAAGCELSLYGEPLDIDDGDD